MKPLKVKPKVLKQLREAHGWSLQLAAAKIGIAQQTLGYLERGFSLRPRRLTLEQIAKTYGVAIEEITT